MEIGIAGAGKVGCSIGKYLKEQGISIAGFYSKTKESVDEAATFTDTKAFGSMEELLAQCEILFITTPDGAIEEVWESIRNESIQNKIICHFSGALSSAVFSNRKEKGVSACSIHPMYAFSNKFTSYEQLNQVMFTMEGDEEALDVVKPIFERAGNKVCVIASESKGRYHAAASMMSNMMVGLYQMGLSMLTDCGFSAEDAKELTTPLVRNNIEAVLATSPEQALTGPIERSDEATIEKHLSILGPGEKEVYVNLGQVLLDIAERKNPARDYHAMRQRFLEEAQEWRTK